LSDITFAVKLPKGSKIPESEVKELISLTGGKINSVTKCNYCIGRKTKDDVKTLKLEWLLDSISDYKKKDMKDYVVEDVE